MNNHRYLTSIKSIKTLPKLLFCVTKQSIKIRKLNEGVSGELKYSRTHMSLDKKLSRRSFLEATGKALRAFGVSTTLATSSISNAIAGDKTENWNDPELEQLHKASNAATNYAENNDGVGILIHVGQDVPNAKIKSAEELGQLFVNRFASLGVEAQFFLRQNDAKASGITYHIGHLIHGSSQGSEVKGLKTAWNSAPDVVEQLKIVKQLASFEAPEPQSGS